MGVPGVFRDQLRSQMRASLRKRAARRIALAGVPVLIVFGVLVGRPMVPQAGPPPGPGPLAVEDRSEPVAVVPEAPAAAPARVIVRRWSESPRQIVRRISDDELLERLAEADRPSGYIQTGREFRIISLASSNDRGDDGATRVP